jgi:hypothetical protein
VIGCDFRRIQFTRSAALGHHRHPTSSRSGSRSSFDAARGPIFAQIILGVGSTARPKVAVGAARAMQEGQVTLEARPARCPSPLPWCWRLRTIEHEGTLSPARGAARSLLMMSCTCVHHPSWPPKKCCALTPRPRPQLEPVLSAQAISWNCSGHGGARPAVDEEISTRRQAGHSPGATAG